MNEAEAGNDEGGKKRAQGGLGRIEKESRTAGGVGDVDDGESGQPDQSRRLDEQKDNLDICQSSTKLVLVFLPPDKLASRTTKARATKFMRHPRHQMPNPDSPIAEMNRNKTPWSPPGHWLLPLPVQPTFVRSLNLLLLSSDLSPRDPYPLFMQ
ncbi:hypothetical protein E4U16_005874 [Claviceps sp. LM84 group G4]|nr:hypothetical protein E4U16_005874 [Claviceps sp. LM84 group G4]